MEIFKILLILHVIGSFSSLLMGLLVMVTKKGG